MSDENSKPAAYEAPVGERPTLATPTEKQLEQETPGAPEAHDPYAALRLRNFNLYQASFFVTVIGSQIQSVTALYEIDQKTHSALSAGWVGLALALPMLIFALPAGQLADTFTRSRIVASMQCITGACALALAAVSYWCYDSPHFTAMVYGLLALGAVATTIGRPARQALLPQVVPMSVFPNAVTWNSSFFEISSMIGPTIGGFICIHSRSAAYVVAAICFAISMVLMVALPHFPLQKSQNKASRLQDLLLGMRFVFSRRLMLSAMTLDLFAVLLGGAVFMLPAYAREVLLVGPLGFGFLRAAPSIGAFTMAFLQAHRPPLKHSGLAMLLAVAGFGAATIGFGLSHSYALSFVMLILTGAFDNISVVVRHTLIQLLTPDYMRGRVSSVNQIFIGSSNELGGFESGVTARLFGLVPSVVIGGIGTIVVVAASAFIWPEMRKLGRLDEVKPEDFDQPQGLQATSAAAS